MNKIFATMMSVMLLVSGIAVPLAATAETEIRILRHPGNGSSRPLLTAVAEVLPEEAAKRGIKDLKITFLDFQVGADAIPLLLNGRLDVFPSGTNNLAVLLSKVGNDVKLLTGWGGFDYKLVCSDPKIRSVRDIGPDVKIAAKAINSAEHYFIKSVAKKELGSFTALDRNMMALPRPQIQQLMEAGDRSVTCAVPGSPIQDALIAKGHAHLVYQSDSVNTIGVSTMSMAMKTWIDANPKLAEAWVAAVRRGSDNFNRDPARYLAIWKDTDKVKLEVPALLQNMKDGNVVQTYRTTSVLPYINTMIELGVIKAPPQTLESLAWRADLLQ